MSNPKPPILKSHTSESNTILGTKTCPTLIYQRQHLSQDISEYIVRRKSEAMCYHSVFIFETCAHVVVSRKPLSPATACPGRNDGLFELPSMLNDMNGNNEHVADSKADLDDYNADEEDNIVHNKTTEDDQNLVQSGSHSHRNSDFEASSNSDDTAPRKERHRCQRILSHPLHTFRIPGPCTNCWRERAERLAKFEVRAIRDHVDRGFLKTQRIGGVQLVDEKGKQERKENGSKGERTSLRAGYVEGKGRRDADSGQPEVTIEPVKVDELVTSEVLSTKVGETVSEEVSVWSNSSTTAHLCIP